MQTYELPAELTTDTLSSWLESLGQLNHVNAANHLNKAIKELKKNDLQDAVILHSLIQLTPTIIFITHNIESNFLLKASDTVSEKYKKIEKLCIQLLRNTAFSFCNFSQEETLTKEEQTLACYLAIQILGYTQRLTAIFHQHPVPTLWENMGEQYNFALQLNVLDETVKHKINNFKQQGSISAALKRNLLFAMLEPYHYHTKQIKELFSFSAQYADLLILNSTNIYNADFFWDSLSGQAPQIKNLSQKKTDSGILIDCSAVLSKLNSSSSTLMLDKSSTAKIQTHLSGYKKLINSFMVSIPNIQHMIKGVDKIIDYLEKLNKLYRIQQLSAEIDDDSTAHKMAIEPMSFEQNHLRAETKFIPNKNISHLMDKNIPVKILPIEDDNYIIAETSSKTVMIGDLILICNDNPSSELGIIKQIKTTNESGTIHLLIELVIGTPSATQMYLSNDVQTDAIIVNAEQDNPELFIEPSRLVNGTKIKLSSGQSLTLAALTDLSHDFMRYSTYS